MSDEKAPDLRELVARELANGPGGQRFIDELSRGTEPKRRLPIVGGRLAEESDKYALRGLPQIDCLARLPACRGRCCGFTFMLSVQDVADGVRFDPQHPYAIAHDDRGMCVHSEGGQCAIYDRRPSICRTYECSTDPRIWIDFEKGIARP